MTLRVNTPRTSRRRYLDVLSNTGIRAWPTRHSPEGVILESPCAVESVPGFGEGLVSVQDEAAQLAAALLDAPRGSRVLDACAAPGGKTAHVLERGAVERRSRRARRRPPAHRGPPAYPGPPSAARLACSRGTPRSRTPGGTGGSSTASCSMRRAREPGSSGAIPTSGPAPAGGYRRDGGPAERHAPARCGLSWFAGDACCTLLAPYCPVKTNRSSGASWWSRRTRRVVRIDAAWGRPAGPGRQILPGEDAMDGFFYAALAKR